MELMFEKPLETTRLLRDAVKEMAEQKETSLVATQMALSVAPMFWGPGCAFRVNEGLFEWFKVVFDLAPGELNAMCHSPIAYEGAQRLCDGIWDRESDLPAESRQWPIILEALAELTNEAIRAQALPIVAGLVRARIIILMDFLGDSEHGARLAREVIPLLTPEPAGEFLVASTIGQQYCYRNLFAEAEQWLDRAIKLEGYGQAIHRVYAFLYAGIVKANRSPSDSVELISRGTAVALSSDGIPSSLRIRALGERAIAVWKASGLGDAYESLRDAAEMLLASDLSTDKDRSFFVLFGNSLGYFMCVASRDVPSAQFITPEPGLYLDFSTRFAKLFVSGNICLIAMQVAHIAEALGRDPDAARFAELALSLPGVRPEARWLMAQQIVPQKAVEGDYAGIVELWNSLIADPITIGAPPAAEDGLAEIPIIAIAFSLAALKLRNETSIGSRAADAAVALSNVSASALSAYKFRRAASLVEEAFASDVSADHLIEIGNSQQSTGLYVISYLGAMFKVPPAAALRAMLLMLPTLKKQLLAGMYRVLVVPFVRAFWRITFDRSRFAFFAPRLVERRIDDALGTEGEASLLPLLTAVATGLGVKAPEKL
jgi:hypothetical protein